MSSSVVFTAVYPIGNTDTLALPVEAIGSAVEYYSRVLGFALVSKDETTAVMSRDAAEIGLAENGIDPEQASCYFAVSDLDALRAELIGRGIEPGTIAQQEHDGKRYRVFFAKEPFGVCFCFGQQA